MSSARLRVPWVVFTFVFSTAAIPWEGPRPTTSSSIIGWDPLPTAAPYVAPPNLGSMGEMGLRRRATDDQVCGTVPGDGSGSAFPITCTGVCQLQASNIVGCCPDTGGCDFSTACIGSADWEKGCSGGGSLTCQSQSNVAICTSSEYPYCGAFGDGTFTMFGCFSTIRVTPREITFKSQIAEDFASRTTASEDDEESSNTSSSDDENPTPTSDGTDVGDFPASTTGSLGSSTTTPPVLVDNKDDGPNIGAIVGGIVGGLAVIVAGVLLALWIVRRNRAKPTPQAPGIVPESAPMMSHSPGGAPMAAGYYADPTKQPSELPSSAPQQQYAQGPYAPNYASGYGPPAGYAEAPAAPVSQGTYQQPPQPTAYQQNTQTYELPTEARGR